MRRSAGRICATCIAAIRRVRPDDPVYLRTLGHLRLHNVDDLVAVFYFEKEGPLQTLLHQLKYGGMTTLATELGMYAGEGLKSIVEQGMLVPVPLHPAKRRERGYNQSEFVCRGIASRTGFSVRADLLERVRFTATQTRLTTAQREKNVGDAFAMTPRHGRELRGQTVIIVDDVITTGSTIASCARILREAGAARIIACSVALAEKDIL